MKNATYIVSMIRREIKSRNTRWAHAIAARLTRRGIRPNHISVAGCFFALGGALAMGALRMPHGGPAGLLLCLGGIAGIQLRLLCNLFDGMVAIEGGMKSASGELFNDFPDRISDALLLIGAGFAAGGEWGPAAGFTAAILAILTAYARVLAGSAGATQRFLGPMAKQHRMALLTLALILAAALDGLARGREAVLLGALALIGLGSLVTVVNRLSAAYRELEKR